MEWAVIGGGGSGPNATIPATGLPLSGGTGQAYRNAPIGMSSLPKSGFGGSNIPAGGMGPSWHSARCKHGCDR